MQSLFTLRSVVPNEEYDSGGTDPLEEAYYPSAQQVLRFDRC